MMAKKLKSDKDKEKKDKKEKKSKVKTQYKNAITVTVKDIPYTIIPIDKETHWEASIYRDLDYRGLVRAETQKDAIRKAHQFVERQNASR